MTVVTSIEGVSLKHSKNARRYDYYVGAKPWAHIDGCECTPEQTYTCTFCGRRFGWCIGGADDETAPCCDFCWATYPWTRTEEDFE